MAPPGKSINDYISKEDFPFHYASIDDATHMLSASAKGALMAKVNPAEVSFSNGSSPASCRIEN